TIVEQAGKRSVLNVQATPFTHASGESVPPGLDGGVTPQQRIELGPYQSKALTLAAPLLRAGAWHSTLRVLDPRTNKAILTLPIDVARVRSEVPVQLVL